MGVARVRIYRDKWQPVGDSNPCDGTENPGATVDNNNNSNDLQAENCEGTPEGTPDTHQNAHLDAVKAALAGLSKDEIISLLADALADKPHTTPTVQTQTRE